MNKEVIEKQFEEEIKSILSGYLSDSDTVDYLALKITRLHTEYSENQFYATKTRSFMRQIKGGNV